MSIDENVLVDTENLDDENCSKNLQIGRIKAKRKGRLILSKQYSTALLSQLDSEYNRYMAEICQLSLDPPRSIDMNLKLSGCFSCDPRLKSMLSIPVASNLQLRNFVTFVPPSAFNKGHFLYQRMWNGRYDFLPSGEQQARLRTEKLLSKINKGDDKIAREASFRLQNLYAEQGLSWCSKFDLQQDCKFLGLLAILKQGSSTSVRVCSIPNSEYTTTIGSLTYNDCIQSLSVAQPRPYRFSLAKMFSLHTVNSDISQQFPSIHLDYKTSLASVFFCYKDKEGWPTFTSSHSVDKLLYAIRNKRLYFGGSDAPGIAEYCMKEACTFYLEYHPHLDEEEKWLVGRVEDVLRHSRFADDLQISNLINHIKDYFLLSSKEKTTTLPETPTWNSACLVEGRCDTKHAVTNSTAFDQYCMQIKHLSETIILKIATKLMQVLNFSGFSLKYLKGESVLQVPLDSIVKNQIVHRNSDKVKMVRPDMQEVAQHINRLNRNSNFISFVDPEPKDDSHWVDYLGYSYSDGEVGLRIQTLSIVYSNGKINIRSPEFYTFQQFTNFVKDNKPTFTKRSLYSAASKNFDTSGRFLIIFRSQIKIAIRNYIKSSPLSRWDDAIDAKTLELFMSSLQNYFFLVKQKLPVINLYKYDSQAYFLLGTSDGSDVLTALSTTIIARTCLNGIVSSKACHLSLHAYSVNINLLSMVDIEMLALIKLCSEFSYILEELDSLGIHIPDRNRYIFTDSRILLTLLRQKIHLMQKKFSFGISKLQLKLFDLKISPYFQIGHIDQKQGTLWSDYYSKLGNVSLEATKKKLKRIHDMAWVESAHPSRLKGVSFDADLPSGAEMKFLREFVIKPGEMKTFQTELQSEIKDPEKIISAAVSVQTESDTKGWHCEGKCLNNNCSQHLKLSEGYSETSWLSDISGDSHSEKCTNASCDSEFCLNDLYENRLISLGQVQEIDLSVQSVSEGEVSSLANLCSETLSDITPVTTMATQVIIPNGSHAVGGYSFADEDTSTWKKGVEELINRKMSFGLGARSFLSILARCIQFSRLCKQEAQKDPELRLTRQRERKERRLIKLEEKRSSTSSANKWPPWKLHNKVRDLHDTPVTAVDLINSEIGFIDQFLLRETPHGQEKTLSAAQPVFSEGDSMEEMKKQAFHYVTHLYQVQTPVKGYEGKRVKNLNGTLNYVLEGRRHRDYEEKKLRRTRLRNIEEGSRLETVLLREAHRASRGLNIAKAELSLVNLHVHIPHAKKKLQQMSHQCPACRRRRALTGRRDDKSRKEELGPSDYLLRSLRWRGARQTVVLDVYGPQRCQGLFEGGAVGKIYGLVLLQLPLKTCKIIPLRSYASEHFLLAMKTYISLQMAPMDVVIGDAASNFRRLQNSSSGYINNEEDQDQKEKIRLYKELETGDAKERLAEVGVFIKIASGDHSVVSNIEKAVDCVKQLLRNCAHSLRSPLTFFELEYVWSMVSLCIASRPIHASANGRLYTAQSLLQLMGQSGLHLGDDKVDVKLGDDEVTERLELMEKRMFELKSSVAEAMMSCVLHPSFLNIQTSEEVNKNRDSVEKAKLDNVYFCEEIFKKTANFSASLLRLCRFGSSGQTALFQKPGPIRPGSYVTRNIADLYLIAKSNENRTIGSDPWLPSWNLKRAFETHQDQRGFLSWEKEEKRKQNEVPGENSRGSRGDPFVELEADLPAGEPPKKRSVKGKKKEKRRGKKKEKKKRNEEESEGEEEEKKEEDGATIVMTRRGRIVKKPVRFKP